MSWIRSSEWGWNLVSDSYSLDVYRNELSDDLLYGPLSVSDEKAILKEMMHGDLFRSNNAREKMILHHLRFAVWMVGGYLNKGVSFEDLIGEANVGLCLAAEKFRPDVGVRFQTYAMWWIRDRLEKAVAANTRTSQMKSPEDRNPERRVVSIDADLKGVSLKDLIADDSVDVEKSVSDGLSIRSIRDAVDDLRDLDADIIRRRYGIGQEEESVKDIAEDYGHGTKWVHKAETKALKRLKLRLKDYGPEEEDNG